MTRPDAKVDRNWSVYRAVKVEGLSYRQAGIRFEVSPYRVGYLLAWCARQPDYPQRVEQAWQGESQEALAI